MRIKNLKAYLLALTLLLTPGKASAEIISYQMKTTLKNGKEAILYFTTSDTPDGYSYVSFDNAVGYISNRDINYEELDTNNEYQELNINNKVLSDGAYIYQMPWDNSGIVGMLQKDEVVHLIAKNKSGWYVVMTDNKTTGFVKEEAFHQKQDQVLMAKITGNNVNIRSSATINSSNIIGFADITDRFEILRKENDWYVINYLDNTGYVSSKYVKEISVDKSKTKISKMVYLTNDAPMYGEDGKLLTILPQYQNAAVYGEKNGYYEVMVDGVSGLIDKAVTARLTETFAVADTSRQIVKVFVKNKEKYRAHYISGKQSTPSDIGCFTISHMLKDYQLTPEHKVKRWIEFNGDEGFHDAEWKENQYYDEVAKKAYELFMKGKAKTYPYDYGSHGCSNMKLEDILIIYGILHVGDNVLVIGPNNLVKDNLLGNMNQDFLIYIDDEYAKIKKCIFVNDVKQIFDKK